MALIDLRTGVRAVVDGCLSYELPMMDVLAMGTQSLRRVVGVWSTGEVEFGILIVLFIGGRGIHKVMASF